MPFNMFYLDQQIKDRNYKITAVGNTFIYPIAGYSKKLDLADLPDGAQVAILMIQLT